MLQAQEDALGAKIDFEVEKTPIAEALQQLAIQTGISIAFSSSFFDPQQTVTFQFEREKIKTVIRQILQDTYVGYRFEADQLILFRIPKPVESYTISGYVEDQATGEQLISASVYCPQYQKGTYTNEYGFFSLTLPTGKTEILFNYLGSGEVRKLVNLTKSTQFRVILKRSIELEEVVVTEAKDGQDIIDQNPGLTAINPVEISSIPALAGEPDVLRIAQQSAGVQSGVDGFGGMFVRGGNNDQNLLLFDGVPLYNANHLFEFFSIYNATAIRSAHLIKGDYSARYGGRLSSVFDVRTREGNQKEWTGEASVGFISGKGTIEGPIGNGEGAVLLTARHSMFDLLLTAINEQALSDDGPGEHSYRFNDLNGKINYTFSEKDRLFLSYYQGGDQYDFNYSDIEEGEDGYNTVKWGNQLFALRWNRVFGDKLFLNTTVSKSRYRFSNTLYSQSSLFFYDTTFINTFFAEIFSKINDWSTQLNFDYHPTPQHYVRFGGGWTHHQFQSQVTSFEFEDNIPEEEVRGVYDRPQLNIQEYNAYLEDDWHLGRKWRIHAGLRVSAFQHPDTTYFRPEPRFGLHFKLNPTSAFHVSFNRMIQYMQLINLYSVGTLDDLWVPASRRLLPGEAWQYSLGYTYKGKKGWALKTEGYYRELDNLYSAFDGVEIDNGVTLEDNLSKGEGRTYGWELSVERKARRLNVAANYAIAWAKRKYAVINNNQFFNAQYDRRYTINITATYQFNPWLQAGLNWTYGSPYPVLSIEEETLVLNSGEERPEDELVLNSTRSKTYHRLDLSLNMQFSRHQIKVGLYNAYGRKNPAFHRLRFNYTNNADYEEQLDPVSLIGVLPSIYYSIKL